MNKVLFLTRSLNVGGAERQLLTLADSLDRTKIDPVIVTFYSGGKMLPEFENRGIRVRAAEKRSRWDVFGFVFSLCGILREEKPDVVFSYLVAANIMAIILKPFCSIPRVIISIRHSYLRKEDYDLLSSILYWVEDHIARFADVIVINSYVGAKNAITRGMPKEKVRIIPNGILTESFLPGENKNEILRNKLGCGKEEILLGLVGRLDPVKGHSLFIESAQLAYEVNNRLRFVCVGDGPQEYRENLLNQIHAAKLDAVFHLIPAETDPVPIYNALDICVSSSIGEGFPNVVAEAMSCGIPCIVTDVGDSNHIIGQTGLVVRMGDAKGLSEAIQQMARLPAVQRYDLGKAARERIITEFSVQKMVESSTMEILK